MAPQRTTLNSAARRARNRRLPYAAPRGLQTQASSQPNNNSGAPPAGNTGIFPPNITLPTLRRQYYSLPPEMQELIWRQIWNIDQDHKIVEVIGERQFWTLTREPDRNLYPDGEGRRVWALLREPPRFPTSLAPPTIRTDLSRNIIYLSADLILPNRNPRLLHDFTNATVDYQDIRRLMIDWQMFKTEIENSYKGFVNFSMYPNLEELYILMDNHSEEHRRIYIAEEPDRASVSYTNYRFSEGLTVEDFAKNYVRQRAPIEFYQNEPQGMYDMAKETWQGIVDQELVRNPNWKVPEFILGHWNRSSRNDLHNYSASFKHWVAPIREKCAWNNTPQRPCYCRAPANEYGYVYL